MSEPVLELKRISKSFSGVEVLKDISLALRGEGSILGLVGENGAGKSTMMNILGGVLQRDRGEILLGGASYNPRSAMDADEAGVAFIHQELNLFSNMTIAENLFLSDAPGSKFGVLSYRAMNAAARRAMQYVGIDISPSTLVGTLPMGMRQMVEIAKALSRKARIIVFDEPTTSLCTEEKEQLFAIIRDFAARSISMIYISHALDDVLALCDEVAVLRDGSIVDQLPAEKATKADIISMMVGRKLDQLFPYVAKRPGEVLLKVEGLCGGKAFRDISFSLRAGEIVGLFGLMGAGEERTRELDLRHRSHRVRKDVPVRRGRQESDARVVDREGRGLYHGEQARGRPPHAEDREGESRPREPARAEEEFRGTRRLSGREGQRGHHRQAEHQRPSTNRASCAIAVRRQTSRRWSFGKWLSIRMLSTCTMCYF